jgi:DNA mismatch endonuclease (patch repair protein)
MNGVKEYWFCCIKRTSVEEARWCDGTQRNGDDWDVSAITGALTTDGVDAVDRLTTEQRSWNMSRIKGRDTGPEKRVRSLLHRLGFRFSLRRRDLPGRPDVVLPRHATVIFVHGCFWHRHSKCLNAGIPKTRRDFWLAKLNSNVQRDRKNAIALKQLGWTVITVWECELRDEAKLSSRLLAELSNGQNG